MNNNKSYDYNQKIDNELKKKEIEDKYSAKFSGGSNISPELESKWLDNIEEFEQQFKDCETTTIWQYIGEPTFKMISEIEPGNVSFELKRVKNIMKQNSLVLDALSSVGEKELYRFITEELFVHKMDNIRIEGMTTTYIYEEFHPNAEYDIKLTYDYLIRATLAKRSNVRKDEYDLLYIDTDNYQEYDGNSIDKLQVKNSINNFLNSFDYFEVISNEIKNIAINEEQAEAQLTFKIHYKGCFNNSVETIDYKGEGTLKLKQSEYGAWDIYNINLPGLKI